MKIKFLMVLLCCFSYYAFAQSIQWSCVTKQENESCNGYINTSVGKTLVVQNVDSYTQQMSTFKAYSKTLGAVVMGCGTECTNTNFVNLVSGKVSSPFSSVIAVNSQQSYVAYLGESSVIVQPIFDNTNQLIIRRDFAPTAILLDDIDDAEFLANGDFYLSYETADPNDNGELTVKVNYNKTNASNS